MFKQTILALTSAAVSGVGFAGSAEAASLNLVKVGNIVQDNRTDLSWLDLSQTDGMTPMQALSAFPEYRLSTTSEVAELLKSAQEDFGGVVPDLNTGVISQPLGGGLRTLFGGTGGFGFMGGRFDDGNGNDVFGAIQYFPGVAGLGFREDVAGPIAEYGVLLVRGETVSESVPEPVSLLGMATVGVVAAGGVLKKKATA
ncbi:PEP-CTERM sorting domain-containing protein [Leptolyngbya iicbica]|nr:PEP-CTERM sorting domain-containing protein [Leptolyngbya sp. LK]